MSGLFFGVEPEDPERSVHGRVQPGGERQYLHGDVGLGGGLDQHVDLGAHDLGAGGSGRAAQRVLVQDQPDSRRVWAAQDVLAGQPQLDATPASSSLASGKPVRTLART